MHPTSSIWTDDLVEPVGLREMLIDGYGIDAIQADAALPTLEGITDLHPRMFVFVRSGAFMDHAATLRADSPLVMIEAFREPGANISFTPFPNPDPQAVLEDKSAKKTPSDAAMGGRVATVALLVMRLLVWLMIKVIHPGLPEVVILRVLENLTF